MSRCVFILKHLQTFLAKLLRLHYKKQKKELGENRQESEIFCHLLLNHLSNSSISAVAQRQTEELKQKLRL